MELLNVFADEWDEWSAPRPEGREWRWRGVGRRLGGMMLGGSLYELPPRQRMFPYHWHAANEELLVVLQGRAVLRGPDGERDVGRGDVVVFPPGPDGAHQLRNDSDEPVRLLMFSTMKETEIVLYPDSDKVGLRTGAGARKILRLGAEADYWEGEE